MTAQNKNHLLLQLEKLEEKGYTVHGVLRRTSVSNTTRLDAMIKDRKHFFLHYGDITDGANIAQILQKTTPD